MTSDPVYKSDPLFTSVYDELRRIAARYISRERPGQTLQATALVNEAFLRLRSEQPRSFADRRHFVAIAALSMRQILVQRARARKAAKRGGAPDRVTLDESLLSTQPHNVDVLALDEALNRLAALDPEQARIVELRYFGGMSLPETAEALGVSEATVKRHWTFARAWLLRELEGAEHA